MNRSFNWANKLVLMAFLVMAGQTFANAAPTSFGVAKTELKKYVYFDRNDDGDFYCGCDWRWVGASGGRIDLASCGYKTRSQAVRAARTEWEHIVPASSMGGQRQCWQNGGRKNCSANDPFFSVMEANMHNITVSSGEVNADRSNFRFAEIPGEATQYGACDAETDFKGRRFEPRPEVRGMIARVNFYIHDRYNLKLSRSQEQLFMAWDRMHPVSEWEKERDRRIAKRMGHSNPFVTGERSWSRGHKNSGEGLANQTKGQVQKKPVVQQIASNQSGWGVRGNKNSHIYHLSVGCSAYEKVAVHNRREFKSEQEAINAGYRKAGNCR